MLKFLVAPIIILALILPFSQTEAKVSYGPCIETVLYYWKASEGSLGIGWVMNKIYANCDKNGDWNEY